MCDCASCSVDSFVYIWDLRDSRRPTISLSAIAEASQVRWASGGSGANLLATAHDGDIKVWDRRRTNAPLCYIAAHPAKIHGLDWSPKNGTQLCSASHDHSVKFFNVSTSTNSANVRRPEFVLTTNAPVWRARFTPFGTGLVTAVVPQLRPRYDHSLFLWNTTSRSAPVHTFIGHRDVILEFGWRKKQCTNSGDFQLITWSKDQVLIVWRIEPFLQKLCGHEPDVAHDPYYYYLDGGGTISTAAQRRSSAIVAAATATNKTSTVPNNNTSNTNVKDDKIHHHQPLQQEFCLLNVQIPNILIKEMALDKRLVCVEAAARQRRYILTVRITFPQAYPLGTPPLFQPVTNQCKVPEVMSQHLLHTVQLLAEQRVAKNRLCLEACLRQMMITLEQLAADADMDGTLYSGVGTDLQRIGVGYNDAYIPFPRTSGARFGAIDRLVCFSRRSALCTTHRHLIGRNDVLLLTPRAFSAYDSLYARQAKYHRSPPLTTAGGDATMVKQVFHYGRGGRKLEACPQTPPTVHVFNVAVLFPAHSYTLAAASTLNLLPCGGRTLQLVCRWNADAAAGVGRWDSWQAWRLAELLVVHPPIDGCVADEEASRMWAKHPFGAQLAHSLVLHFAISGDVQMAAMLACVFGKYQRMMQAKSDDRMATNRKSSASPYHTVPANDHQLSQWLRQLRSTSMSNLRGTVFDESTTTDDETIHLPFFKCSKSGEIDLKCSASSLSGLYEHYKLLYADMLYRWQLPYRRTELLKQLSVPAARYAATVVDQMQQQRSVEFVADCCRCNSLRPSKVSSPNCAVCKHYVLNCVVCHVSVKGLANSCLICGHGGHTIHLQEWFGSYDVCPSGCGCHCLCASRNVFSC